jgi:hypothetical protein
MLEETFNGRDTMSVTHSNRMIGSDLHCHDMICSIKNLEKKGTP